MCFFFAVAIGGFWVHLSPVEFALALTVAGFVLALEAVNTAFEIDIDLTSPEYHAMARDAKDVAAGAVLIASFVAIIVNVIIFYPHISMYL